MPRNIGIDAEIDRIRLIEQSSAPSSPDSGYGFLYAKNDGGLYFKNDSGTEIGPLTAGSTAGAGWTQVFEYSGSSLTGWEQNAGTAYTTNGTVIIYTSDGNVRWAYPLVPMPNSICMVEAQVQIKSSAGRGGISTMIAKTGGGSAAGDNPVAYLQAAADNVILERAGAAVRATLPMTVDIDTWYTMRMLSSGNTSDLWVNGTYMGCAHGMTSASHPSFYVGLYGYQTTVWYRNIKAWIPTYPA